MAAKATQKEIEFIIRVLEPEQRANGTLAIHCRPSSAIKSGRTAEPASSQRPSRADLRRRKGSGKHSSKNVDGIWRPLAVWGPILLAICSAALCYLAVATAEMSRRGYYSVGGELLLSIAVGYFVYRCTGMKKTPA